MAQTVVDNRPPAGFDGTQQVVLVSRAGGAWLDDLHLDRPLVDLEVYAADKTVAHGIALAARACVLELVDTHYGGAVVTEVDEADGPRWLPDYNRPAGNRYLATLRLSIRPA
ncbi:hypothetical protein [Streptomyces sp. PKU-EA00015]|uniref:hypothetical protein n=1 Tax=Streptomyces sp. PKU-EA00015 TaxID=2748326 RepID=UPI0028128028|nr:hypothetical protein [Streptomyces sp. PKU-EA00015]